MVRVACKGKLDVLLTKFSMMIGKMAACQCDRYPHVANDNPSREQILFEKCIDRELGGITRNSAQKTDSEKDEAHPRSH